MTRITFERELSEIQEDMFAMANMVETAISRGIQALKNRDLELAQGIITDDLAINKKRYDTEEKCLEIMATQQPLAGDLRTLVSVLYITVDLERMGDHAEGIAKIAVMLGDEPSLKPYIDIPKMAEVSIEMLRGSLEAYRDRDTARARVIVNRDDEVDALYDKVYRDLLTLMINDPETIQRATYLIWAAHNLERIADRVTNICERVVYLVEGKIEDLNVSKY
ncbi:MAG: phosphate signaling complex protein PhoU [Chloroflexi bacterium]|nr:phosphate signaling complex protein PhoU [Chloroflexota bacterium]